MLLLDLQNWTIKWNATIDDTNYFGKSWTLESSEISDELEGFSTGYETSAVSHMEEVTN